MSNPFKVGQLIKIFNKGLHGRDNLAYLRSHMNDDSITFDTIFVVTSLDGNCIWTKMNDSHNSREVGAFASRFVLYNRPQILLADSLFEA